MAAAAAITTKNNLVHLTRTASRAKRVPFQSRNIEPYIEPEDEGPKITPPTTPLVVPFADDAPGSTATSTPHNTPSAGPVGAVGGIISCDDDRVLDQVMDARPAQPPTADTGGGGGDATAAENLFDGVHKRLVATDKRVAKLACKVEQLKEDLAQLTPPSRTKQPLPGRCARFTTTLLTTVVVPTVSVTLVMTGCHWVSMALPS
jgi:hypothetical protein